VGRGRSFLATAPKPIDYVLGGWMLGWNFSATSGTPVGLNTGVNYLCPLRPPQGTSVGHWLNPELANSNCWSPAPPIGGTGFTYTSTPSNTTAVRTYTVPNLDLSLQKSFKITERVSFSLRGEAFNSLNSVLLGGPDNNPGDGAPSLVYNDLTKRSYWSGFGVVTPAQQNDPRNLRVSGRITF